MLLETEQIAKGPTLFSSAAKSRFSHFIRNKKVGKGTYAVVYNGLAVPRNVPFDLNEWRKLISSKITDLDLCDNESLGMQIQFKKFKKIAIKKIRVSSGTTGVELSAIREIKFLQELKHPNIIEGSNLNLVLEYLELDLEIMIRNERVAFGTADIKSWLIMLLRGIRHCHQRFILHRDLKPSNLLLTEFGVLKIADFGMSREFGTVEGEMTPVVVTRWYRAPELLLGSSRYGYGVDIWAIGCIFAELMLRAPYFPGESDIGQLHKIFCALGTPTAKDWPGMKHLPGYYEPAFVPKIPLKATFTAASGDTLDVLASMLTYDPLNRPTADTLLRHSFFTNEPKPNPLHKLPKLMAKEVIHGRGKRYTRSISHDNVKKQKI